MIYISEIINGKHTLKPIACPVFQKIFDVIVCGMGTAGSLSALYSAENGLKVLGVEKLTCVGGTHTAGGVIYHYFGNSGGRYEKLDQEVRTFAKRYTGTQAESRKLLLEQALNEQGVEIFYEASICGVYIKDKTVIGVRVLTNHGIEEYGAKVVLDCTAEAEVAVMAGCETEFGRETDGQTQPYSVVSMMYDNGSYGFTNVDFGRVNQCDKWSLSQAVLFSRAYKMKEGHSGVRVCQVPLIGIREGRRIVSEETVRLDDLFADRQTATPAFFSYADLDKHGWDIAFDSEALGDWAIGANLGAYNVTVAVPYKAILPKGYDGLLVPCRALGVDRDLSSCVRMNPDMKKLAEVAAEWVTLALKSNQNLRDVPYSELREKLLESGCLNEEHNRGYRIDGRVNWDGSSLNIRDVCWITNPSELEKMLKTETPGEAIWSAKRMGTEALPILLENLKSDDENLRKHSAFAVAILESFEANAILRDMVIKRDGLMLKDCRKNNNLRGCMAIYWLGRLADREITPELMQLICNPNEQEKPIYHQNNIKTTRYKINGYKDIYFQFMSQSVMALIRIGDRHKDLREQIAESFINAFSTDEYYSRITQKPVLSSEGNMVKSLKTIAFSAAKRWDCVKE